LEALSSKPNPSKRDRKREREEREREREREIWKNLMRPFYLVLDLILIFVL
jgi:hypothetical protein